MSRFRIIDKNIELYGEYLIYLIESGEHQKCKGNKDAKQCAYIYIACKTASKTVSLREIYEKMNSDESLVNKNMGKIIKVIKDLY